MDDLVYTSQVGRRVFEKRLAVIADSPAEIADALRAFSQGAESPALVLAASRFGAARAFNEADAISVDQLLRQNDPRGLAQRWASGAAVDWRSLWSALTILATASVVRTCSGVSAGEP